MRIGVTGHMKITGETAEAVAEALRGHLARFDRDALVGVTCLAPGADSLFAEAILEIGVPLEVVVPSADYRRTQVPADCAVGWDAAIAAADVVTVLPFAAAGPEAYAAANEMMLGSIDELVAVWDGRPAQDAGGTGAAVAEARRQGVPVTVIWPQGAVRG
ncbi:MAG: hypothetical protein JF587_16705 [Catenulisporales bacterium]|nr:hypothetical protein [Catenulisporales bacterium]